MSGDAIVITGIDRHSLGEALVKEYLGCDESPRLIGIDRVPNEDLQRHQALTQLVFDLNPMTHGAGVGAFSAKLSQVLADAVPPEGIECLIHCAGLYASGPFVEHTAESRSGVLGLNILGTTETLYAVMKLNAGCGRDNSRNFTFVLIGSFQGLYAREGRSIYAPSKSYGLDLCTSLAAGNEIARCIYIAPRLIDTPMLHRNHWVTKSGGSSSFFDSLLRGPRNRYTDIFVNCNEAVFEKELSEAVLAEAEALRTAMAKYRSLRAQILMGGDTLSPKVCAAAITRILVARQVDSGVVTMSSAENGETCFSITPYSSLDRRKMLSTGE